MKMRARFPLLVLASALALGSVACGGRAPAAQTANVKPDNMPTGETWQGVYFHTVFGYLHLVESGNNVVGRWKTTAQDKWGELSGVKVGNVLHFTWTEHIYGRVDPASIRRGKGVFVYSGQDNTAEIKGQYGLGNDEVGSEWNCKKQKGMRSNPDSISGDTGGTSPAVGGGWD